jgi:two-component system, chemotaxis family, chemotaxis protein CheY
MESFLPRKVEKLLQSIEVLVIDDNPYMRKVVRNLLTSIGVKNVHEAVDGAAGLEAIPLIPMTEQMRSEDAYGAGPFR